MFRHVWFWCWLFVFVCSCFGLCVCGVVGYGVVFVCVWCVLPTLLVLGLYTLLHVCVCDLFMNIASRFV